MKKFVVLLVVVALTLITSAVMAAEVTVGGELAIRSRNFDNMDRNDDQADAAGHSQRDTQTRVKIDVNAKAGDVKGKIQLWNDFESWGDNPITSTSNGATTTFETQPGSSLDTFNGGVERNTIGFREAWISFPLPGVPVTVTAGHQLLTVGNGWFFRSQHYGSDAWVVSNTTANNTLAFVNVKVSEGASVANSDDVDGYVLLDVMKLSDDMSVGADLSYIKMGRAAAEDDNLMNIGLNFNGKLGPIALKAELDLQMGEADATSDYAGNQIVIQGSMNFDPVTANFTLARGSGQDAGATDVEQYQNFLDIDPHYTFLWEYKMGPGATATSSGAKNFGFANTTALGLGATFAATKSLTVGADYWMLMATEDVGGSDDYGQEIDVKVNWKVAENLSWNWVLGYFDPGDIMGNDPATGIQGILAFKF